MIDVAGGKYWGLLGFTNVGYGVSAAYSECDLLRATALPQQTEAVILKSLLAYLTNMAAACTLRFRQSGSGSSSIGSETVIATCVSIRSHAYNYFGRGESVWQ